MKPVNRYISLLLICGLMLPLYNKDTYYNIGKKQNPLGCQEKLPSVKASDNKTDEIGFSFFKDVIANLTPVLKNLK